MSTKQHNHLEAYLKDEMLQLKLMSFTIKKASKRFNLSKDEVKSTYLKVRSMIRKEAINRGIVYLLLSTIFLFVGIKSVQGNSGYIYLGGLLLGSAGILTALGYFVLAIKGSSQ
ncbi:hypothetical protein [Winogradskyella thalassocola]|uniref:Uncharacterized protein n=1 Tax=Winogradskyella thalassocola TaxID=262004 RepID=A0A1G8D6S0_9FLAO|nr:hypothetical protein [Winogradskyella thalassocola]SDH52970.1 hypothetical protein SAMN04489796_103127 [Winogradskyella thalassocola]